MSSFLAAVLSSPDQSPLFTSALQLVELFLVKLDDYAYFFRREGVLDAVERIASEPILTPPKSKRSSPTRTPKVSTDTTSTGPSGLAQALSVHAPAASASTPVVPALSATDALVKDTITRRAQHIRDTHITVDSGPMLKARAALEAVELLVARLDAVTSGAVVQDDVIVQLMSEVAALFSDELSPLSSFELSRSGLIEGLLRFTTLPNPDRSQSPSHAQSTPR